MLSRNRVKVMLSYSKGPELPLRCETVYQAFAAAAARFPNRLALVSRPDNLRWTYRELQNEVDRAARGLIGLGLHCGDRVAIWAASCSEWILLQLACPRLGVILVNVNPAYRALDLGYVIRKSRVRAIFHHPKDARANYDSILKEALAGGPSSLENNVSLGTDSWSAMLASAVDLVDTPVNPHCVVNIQYTSGTTGSPSRGIVLIHHP